MLRHRYNCVCWNCRVIREYVAKHGEIATQASGEPFGGSEEPTGVTCVCCAVGQLVPYQDASGAKVEHSPGLICKVSCPRHLTCPRRGTQAPGQTGDA